MTTHTSTQLPVIIVGGGLSGLSAAALLAKAGHAVKLFEKASTPGGRARTSQQSGFFFNQGAHAFYLHGAGTKVLNELGVRYSGLEPARSRYLALEGGKLYPLPASVASTLETHLLSFAAKAELAGLFARIKYMDTAKLQHVSLQDWLAAHVKHPQVCQFLLAGARLATYSNAPDLLSAALLPSLLNAQVLYVDGGWQTLVDGLQHKAQEAGAEIRTQARVRAIEVAGEGYSIQLADGSSHAASAVLLATDPEMASALVLNGTHEALHRWAAQAIPARATCFDIGLRRLPRAQNLFALGIDRPLYYSVHSASAHLAPQGSALVHIMHYLQPDESPKPEATRQEMEAIMDLLQPGWRAEVVEQYFLPHMIASNAIVQAQLGGLAGRPGPAVPGLPHLYVAGDWVGMEGTLADACFASASSAARLIISDLARQQSVSRASVIQ
ncbi:dehydrogenase [Reticulibacter mediterranei]|uniref:Dehydrogenase n=1 Tax=Reticulibacter mediterranei TaxID=2778369 RepID=A0A8J3ILY8_9CHLR|nr:FAD-dependent oxidoreductase [Reticulibacter mediterranei]GHO96363.1 dehydrogenase [Reticulibacter mediterranei]